MLEDHFGDEVAARYDADETEMFDASVIDPVVDFLVELAGGGPALELGIGTGRIAIPLAQRGIQVHGIDLSEAMVARRGRSRGAEPRGIRGRRRRREGVSIHGDALTERGSGNRSNLPSLHETAGRFPGSWTCRPPLGSRRSELLAKASPIWLASSRRCPMVRSGSRVRERLTDDRLPFLRGAAPRVAQVDLMVLLATALERVFVFSNERVEESDGRGLVAVRPYIEDLG